MSFYHRLPFDNLKQIQETAVKKIPLNDYWLYPSRLYYPNYGFLDDPLLVDNLKKYNLYDSIRGIGLFILGPMDTTIIHDDGDLIDGTRQYTWSCNIPLKNCSNTFTSFFESDQIPVRQKSPTSTVEYNVYQPENCKKVASLELVDPYILNVSKPHQILNLNGDTQRIALAIRLDVDFDIDQLVSMI